MAGSPNEPATTSPPPALTAADPAGKDPGRVEAAESAAGEIPDGVIPFSTVHPPAKRQQATTDTQLANQMTAVYNQVVKGTPLRQARSPKTPQAIADLVRTIRQPMFQNGDLSDWREYCRRAAADPHCRGETNGADYPTWTATLAHIIQPHVIDRFWQAFLASRPAPVAPAETGLNGEPLPDWYIPGNGSLYWQELCHDPKQMADHDAWFEKTYPAWKDPAEGDNAASDAPAGPGDDVSLRRELDTWSPF